MLFFFPAFWVILTYKKSDRSLSLKKVESAGGVVFYRNAILLLKKKNGFWVLPKGHVEFGETKMEAALREVREEGGVVGTILEYIDYIEYEFTDFRNDNEFIHKKVWWFIMHANSPERNPQLEEGFVEASYVPIEEAVGFAKHEDERKIIKKAIQIYKNKYGE